MDLRTVLTVAGHVSSVLGIIGFLVLVVQLVQIYRLRQALRFQDARVGQSRVAGNLVINFSGHPMSPDSGEGGWLRGKQIVDQPVANLDPRRPVSELQKLLGRLEPECLERLKRGEAVVVALPGATVFASHLLVMLHGLSGSFPLVTWSVERKELGRREWVKPADLHAVRTKARRWRRDAAKDSK